jgi:hypothetical protein
MTDPRAEPAPDAAADATPEAASGSTSGATSEPSAPPTFEERMEDFGRRAETAGQKLGREAQAAGERWSKDPAVVGAADTAGRVWGLLVLAAGLWFFADVTLGIDMPAIAWRDLWPIALIVVGLAVVLRGVAGRRT